MMVKKFINDQSGAITVDWVVLTASIVGIAIAVLIIIAGGLHSASTGVNGDVETASSVADQIGDNNGGLPGNVSDYTNDSHAGDHQHYVDESDGTRYTVDNATGVMTDPYGTQVGTVDGDGNITAI